MVEKASPSSLDVYPLPMKNGPPELLGVQLRIAAGTARGWVIKSHADCLSTVIKTIMRFARHGMNGRTPFVAFKTGKSTKDQLKRASKTKVNQEVRDIEIAA